MTTDKWISAALVLLAGGAVVGGRAYGVGQNSNTASSVSFGPTISIPSPFPYPTSLAVGDLNHDGLADLGVVGNETPGMCVALATPGMPGLFGSWSCGPGGADAPVFALFADLNLDGNLDAISTDADLPILAVAPGNGQGQIELGKDLQDGNCGYGTGVIAVADLNGDGIPDIVTTALGIPDCVVIFLGLGHGKFAPAKNLSSGGIHPYSLAVGDLNHDGIPDLVIANFGSEQNGDYGNIAVRLGRANGTYAAPVTYTGLHDPEQVILADFNRDGNLDLAVVALGRDQVYVSLGKGDGTFLPPIKRSIPGGVGWIAVADFNGDGVLDLAATIGTEQQGGVAVSLGNGDGTFQLPVNFKVGLNPLEIAIGDFNGDGKPDIATVNGGDSTISILLNTTPWPKERSGIAPSRTVP